MLTAESIARALGGKRSGKGWKACCPAHDDHDPSLSIDEGDVGKVLVNCHAGCEQDAVINALRTKGLWPDERKTAPENSHSKLNGAPHRQSHAPPRDPEFIPRHPKAPANSDKPENEGRTAHAVRIFQEAGPLQNTPGWAHLIRRGIDVSELPQSLNEVLRWHPHCPWQRGTRGCMVALFTDVITGEPKAIHRTAITQNGEKVGRQYLGPMAECVIRLWPDDAVTTGIAIGEGIETVLAAATRIIHRGTLLRPVWAAGDANNIASLPVLAGIESLTLLVDHDANQAGETAAKRCTERWIAAGREVHWLVPHAVDADFNDIIKSLP